MKDPDESPDRALALSAALYGCATPYTPVGVPGGHNDSQLAEDVFRITFKGNAAATKLDQVQDMALLRYAEVVKEKGLSHFVLLDESTRVQQESFTTPR